MRRGATNRPETVPPRYSVAQETTPRLTFAEAVWLYAQTGAVGIGIDFGKLGGCESDQICLKESGMRATYCTLPVSSFLPIGDLPGLPPSTAPADPAARVDLMCTAIPRLASFGALGCAVGAGPCGSYEPEQAREIVVDGLRRVARTAAELGMGVAFEPIHPNLGSILSFVNDIPTAAAIIVDTGEPNVGVTADIWHLSDDPSFVDDLVEHVEMLSLVHINDRTSAPRSWCDRVLPGDGVADLDEILAALARAGYDGWYELEVISDDGRYGNAFDDSLWKLEPADLLLRGRSQFMAAWNAGVADTGLET